MTQKQPLACVADGDEDGQERGDQVQKAAQEAHGELLQWAGSFSTQGSSWANSGTAEGAP